jgi:hypothetical protein
MANMLRKVEPPPIPVATYVEKVYELRDLNTMGIGTQEWLAPAQ